MHGILTGQTVQDMFVATVMGFVAFAVTFGGTLYFMVRRRAAAQPAPPTPSQPTPPTPSIEDQRVELVREARKELANEPPPAAPVTDVELDSVVRDLQRRATSGRASKPPGDR